MILITDAHVSTENGNVDEFFAMLRHLGDSDGDVVFLGDILELWIGLPRYEAAEHARFLAWCRAERDRRSIGFVEGNHEFFVARNHRDAFTWVSSDACLRDGALFTHGDRIDRTDRGYAAFRACTKNGVVHWLLRRVPGAPSVVRWIKRRMEHSAVGREKCTPEDQLAVFAAELAGEAERIYCGHFHRRYTCEPAQAPPLFCLPPWQGDGVVTVVDEGGALACLPWREALGASR